MVTDHKLMAELIRRLSGKWVKITVIYVFVGLVAKSRAHNLLRQMKIWG